MHCEKCHKKKSTVIYHENISGRARTLHLCADCADTMEAARELEDMSAAFAAFSSPLLGIADRHVSPLQISIQAEDRTCSVCRISSAEIVADGRVGCSSCYDCFSDWLGETLTNLCERGGYRGKVARLVRVREENGRRMRLLRAQLADAIATEQYEQAAILRDRIRELDASGDSVLNSAENTQREEN